jgi:hypothetical protein
MDDWLVRHFTVFGIPFQNAMVIDFALIMIAAMIAKAERR